MSSRLGGARRAVGASSLFVERWRPSIWWPRICCGTSIRQPLSFAATRQMRARRPVLAALSDTLQRRIVSYEDLVCAHVHGPRRNSRFADDVLEDLGAGTRSAPEADFRRLVLASTVLPSVDYNIWPRLTDGRTLCVDALITSSAVIHETNGRIAHEREDLFERYAGARRCAHDRRVHGFEQLAEPDQNTRQRDNRPGRAMPPAQRRPWAPRWG
jgi:hypothetical protein